MRKICCIKVITKTKQEQFTIFTCFLKNVKENFIGVWKMKNENKRKMFFFLLLFN